jgi:hypothetical protein
MMHTDMPSAAQPTKTSSGASNSAWSHAVGVASRDFNSPSVSALAAAGEGTAAGRRWSTGVSYAAGPLAGGLTSKGSWE